MELDELLMLEDAKYLGEVISDVSWLIEEVKSKKVKKYLKHYLKLIKVLKEMKDNENPTNN